MEDMVRKECIFKILQIQNLGYQEAEATDRSQNIWLIASDHASTNLNSKNRCVLEDFEWQNT